MFRRIRTICILLATITVPHTTLAQERLTTVGAEFATWLSEQTANGVLALFDGPRLIGHAEHGLAATDIVEIASLSKAITAICASELVREGRLDWSDPFDDIYGSGPDVPLKALVTHSGGLGPDGTQMGMAFWFDRPGPFARDVLGLMEARGGNSGKAGAYDYNNENYALLGLAIEAASEARYVDACRARVLSPAGAMGGPGPRSGGFLPWGGWGMTVADFGRVMAHWFAPQGDIAQDPFAYPAIKVGGSVHYGLGVFQRQSGSGYSFWHFGALCLPRRFAGGAYAITTAEGWTLVAAYDACPEDGALRDMQSRLLDALDAEAN